MQARLEGQLASHRGFAALVALTILGTPAKSHGMSATLTPNPMNPVATLAFATKTPGSVSVRIYDVAGVACQPEWDKIKV